MLRPTFECIQTLLLLTVELQNDHQLSAAWALLGTTARLAQSIGIPSSISNTIGHDQDALMARYVHLHRLSRHSSKSCTMVYLSTYSSRSIVWQDIMLALVHNNYNAGPAVSSDIENLESYEPDVAQYLPVIFRFQTLGIHLLRRKPPAQRDTREGSDTRMRLHELREMHRDIWSRDSKSMKDRYEHAALKLYTSHMLAKALPHFNDREGNSTLGYRVLDPDKEPTELGHQAYVDVMQTFIDFSAISNVAVRTWMMVHCTLDAALELCVGQQLAISSSTVILIARLAQLLGAGTDTDVSLSPGHASAVRALVHFCRFMEQNMGEGEERLPYQVHRELEHGIGQLANTEGAALESQALWGL